MNRRDRGLFLVLAGIVIAACSSEGASKLSSDEKDDTSGNSPTSGPGGVHTNDTPVTTKTGLPCDVDAVLKKDCQTCHGDPQQYGAPNKLVTFDDVSALKDRVKARIHDASRPMPPVPSKMSDADIAVLDKWIEGGAPSSPDSCTALPPSDGVKPLSCKPDVVLKSNTPFTMAAGGDLDQYVCIGVDVNLTKKRHITGLAPHTDNKKILHHILLFQSPKAEPATPTPCAAFGSAAWKLVAGWAPGGANVELPPEAGYPEEVGTTHWVLQLHYNNALNATGEKDNSGYELCTTEDLRPNDAGVLAFGSTKFSIPPRATATVNCTYKLGSEFKGTTTFFNGSPHMHTRGTAMSSEKIPAGATTGTKLVDQPAFDFNNQANYEVTGTAVAGDTIRTKCTWKNPGDAKIGFGEGTADEMCFDFLSYYPAIPDKTILGLPVFTWITPSQSATCAME